MGLEQKSKRTSVADLNDPHAMQVEEVVDRLGTTIALGLSSEEAQSRLTTFGRNVLTVRQPVKISRILWNQVESPVVALLAVAAVVAMFFAEWKEGAAIIAVLVINTILGFVTELRAMRSMEALRSLGRLTTRVRRDGNSLLLPAESLVPGDIVVLEAGDVVTADLRLIEAFGLTVDESTLTGESVAVTKNVAPVEVDGFLGDRTSMTFKGTSIAQGSGLGVVVATGKQSELGKISKLVEESAPEHSPLERQLERLSGQLIGLTLTTVILIAVIGVTTGRDVFMMIEASIALAVAAIPEGLPIVATMALARGMWRMAKQNALIRRLASVETLGAATVIFTDKTGTLTENKMLVREIDLPSGLVHVQQQPEGFSFNGEMTKANDIPNLIETLNAAVLCNNAEIGPTTHTDTGDPLELALLKLGLIGGKDRLKLLEQFPEVGEVAFDSNSKMMATIHETDDSKVIFVKGAPEAVIDHATFYAKSGLDEPLSEDKKAFWLQRTNAMAARGLRVIAVARKKVLANDDNGPVYDGLSLIGLLGLHDPPRADIRKALVRCREAGIRVIMITGDHAVTASSIASAIGLTDRQSVVVEGRELKTLNELTEDEKRTIRHTKIFARVSPEQKLELVSVYQADGEIVAMTGDGVNDAPALKKADIGVAMGRRGTQVAREAAAMVLQDDAFGTIVVAIREGRIIFRNIQRFVSYLLSCNLSEVLIVGLAILLGLPLPLLPVQILFLNLVTDVFPAFALGLGEGDQHTMRSPPRDPKKPIVTRAMWLEIIGHGISITLATLGALGIALLYLGLEKEEAVTVSFLTLAFAQLWHVFTMRDARSGVFKNSVSKNRFVWAAVAFSTAILLFAVYTPVVASLLSLSPPTAEAWGLILLMGFVPAVIGQGGKFVARIVVERQDQAHSGR